MIGDIRISKSKIFYLIFSKTPENLYKTYSRENGYQIQKAEEMEKDKIIMSIKKRVVRRLDFNNFLRLVKTAYETNHD